MPTGNQIRAARALLDWSTDELSKRSGVNVKSILNYEGEISGLHQSTLEKLLHALTTGGIEFLPGEGIRKKDRMVETLEGRDAYQKLLDDIYNTLKDTGGEVLIAYVDEAKGIEIASKDFLQKHLDRLKKANITERLLVREGDPNLIAPVFAYHAIPEKYFSPHQFYIYGAKIAHLARLDPPKAIVINDERFASSMRGMFNFAWDQTVVPKRSKGAKS